MRAEWQPGGMGSWPGCWWHFMPRYLGKQQGTCPTAHAIHRPQFRPCNYGTTLSHSAATQPTTSHPLDPPPAEHHPRRRAHLRGLPRLPALQRQQLRVLARADGCAAPAVPAALRLLHRACCAAPLCPAWGAAAACAGAKVLAANTAAEAQH